MLKSTMVSSEKRPCFSAQTPQPVVLQTLEIIGVTHGINTLAAPRGTIAR
jgi:hypothetical protein